MRVQAQKIEDLSKNQMDPKAIQQMMQQLVDQQRDSWRDSWTQSFLLQLDERDSRRKSSRSPSARGERCSSPLPQDSVPVTSPGSSQHNRHSPSTATGVALSPSSIPPSSPQPREDQFYRRSADGGSDAFQHDLQLHRGPGKKPESLLSPSLRCRDMPPNIVPVTFIRTSHPACYPARESLDRVEGQRRRAEVASVREVGKPPGSPLLSTRRIIETPSSPNRCGSFEPSASSHHRQVDLQQRHSLQSTGSTAPAHRGLERHSLRSTGSTAPAHRGLVAGSTASRVPASPVYCHPVAATTPVSKQPAVLSARSQNRKAARSMSPAAAAKARATGLAPSFSHSTLRAKKGQSMQGSPASAGMRNVTPPGSYRIIGRSEFPSKERTR